MRRILLPLLLALCLTFGAGMTAFAAIPTTQAKSIYFTNVLAESITVKWTKGNGARRIVLAKEGDAPVLTAFGTGENFAGVLTANANFTLGTDVGSETKVVYDGTGNSVTVTALTGGNTYYFMVLEYNWDGTVRDVKVSTATSNPREKTTVPAAPTLAAISELGHNMAAIPWEYDGALNYFEFTLSEAVDYSTHVGDYNNLDIGDAEEFSVSDLTPSTQYYYRVRTVVNGIYSDWATGDFVTDANAAPAFSPAGPLDAVVYAENDANTPVAIAPTITLTDDNQESFNNELFSYAEVIIGANGEAEDALSVEVPGTINAVATYDAPSFTLTIEPAPGGDYLTLEEMQTLLRAIKFHNTSQNPTDATRSIQIIPYDQYGANGNIDAGADVNPVNDHPVLSTSTEDALVYVEATPEAVVLADISISDFENDNLAFATVEITGGADPNDELAVDLVGLTLDGVATANYNAVTHILTISPVGASISMADMTTILNNVTFVNWNNNPTGADRVITYKIDDGNLVDHESNSIARTIDFQLYDDPPTYTLKLVGGFLETKEDEELEITFDDLMSIADFEDPDTPAEQQRFKFEDALVGGIVTATSNDGIQIPNATEMGANGKWYFTPTLDLNGDAVAHYNMSIGGGSSFIAALEIPIHILPKNDAPTLTDLVAPGAVIEDGANITVPLAGIDEGGAADENAQDLTITYSLTPLTGNIPAVADVAVPYVQGDATASIEIDPAADIWGTATLTVKVADNGGVANGGTDFITKSTTITITEVNDPPTYSAAADPGAVEEDGDNITYTISDLDEGGAADENVQQILVTVTGTSNPDLAPLGSISVSYAGDPAGDHDASGDAVITVDPPANKNGVATITYTITDGHTTDELTFHITVNEVNDAPTAITGVPASLDEEKANGFVIGTLGATDVDAGQTYAYTIGGADAAYVTLGGASGNELRVANRMNYEDPAFADHQLNITITVENTGVNPLTTNFGPVAFNIALNDVNEAPTLTSIGPDYEVVQDKWIEVTYASLVSKSTGLADVDVFDPTNTLKFRIKSITDGWSVKWVKNGGPNASLDTALGSAEERLWVKGPLDTFGDNLTGFTVVAWDGALESAPAVPVVFDVLDNNDAPVWSLNNADYGTFNDMLEDATVLAANVTPTRIIDLIANGQTDVDALAKEGLGIRNCDNANGTWQYSLDGTTWVNIPLGSLSDDNVLNIGSDDDNALRFIPNANFSGTTTITAYAWDQTNEEVDDGDMSDPTPNGLDYPYSTTTHTWTFDIVDLNDAPTFADLTNVAAYTENAVPVVLDGDASINDIDVLTPTTANAMTGATLTVAITAGAEADDDLRIQEVNNLAWATATELNYNGTKVADLAGVAPFNTFTLTFTANATPEALNAIMRSVTYVSVADAWTSTNKTITITYNDNGGDLTPNGTDADATINSDITLTITPVNDPPAIANLDGAPELSYTENFAGSEGGPGYKRIDAGSNATITDPDGEAVVAGATLTLSWADGSHENGDLIGAAWEMIGGARVYWNGMNLVYDTDDIDGNGGEVTFGVATHDASSATTPLSVELNGSATLTHVNALMRSIAYKNANDAWAHTAKTLVVTYTDGPAAASDELTATQNVAIEITPVNDAPALAGIGTTHAVTEQLEDDPAERPVIFEAIGIANGEKVFTSATITDPDALAAEGTTEGIAITDIDDANGTWMYWNTLSSTWEEIETIATGVVSEANAFHMLPGGKIKFVPNANFNTPLWPGSGDDRVKITYRAWDASNLLANYTYANIAATGGTTAYSSADLYFGRQITPVNDAPTFNVIADVTRDEDCGLQTVNITGFDEGGIGTENAQAANWTVTSDNQALIPNASISIGSIDEDAGTAVISFTPAANAFGETNITVTANDDGSNVAPNVNTFSRTFKITINPINDAPVVVGAPLADLAYTENDPAVTVIPDFTITDVDDTHMEGLYFGVNSDSPQDEITYTIPAGSGIVAAPVDPPTPGTREIEFTGHATIAQYKELMESIKYRNTSDDPVPLTRLFMYIINDGSANGDVITRNLNITPVNDTPTIALSSDEFAYNENDGVAAINTGAAITDVDDDNLSQAVITLTNYQAGEDVISVTPAGGVTIASNVDGVMTLTGAATKAAYAGVINSLTYENTSENPNTTEREFTLVVTDGNSDGVGAQTSAIAEFSIDVNEINDTPGDITNAPAIPASIDENSEAGIMSITLGVTDAESATQNYTYTLGGANADKFQLVGTTLTNKAGINYETDEVGDHTFTITVTVEDNGTTNGVLDKKSRTETYNIAINNINDAPVSGGDSSSIVANYWEGDPGVPLHKHLTIADEDAGSTMTRIRASFVSGFVASQDELSATFGGKFELFRDGLDGSIEITAKAGETPTTAEWQEVVRTVNFRNTSGHATIAPNRVVRVTVYDNGDPDPESFFVDREVQVHDRNSTPILTTGVTADVTFTEDGAPQTILPNMTVADLDDKVTSAEIWVSANAAEGDALSMTPMAGMTASYDAGTYKLTITADATVDDPADMQTALRGVKFANTSNSPSTLQRTISFRVDDGEAPPESNLSNIISHVVTVNAVNDAPTLTVNNITFVEDGPASPFSGTFTEVDFPGTNLNGHVLAITQLEGPGDGYEAGDEVKFEDGNSFSIVGGNLLRYNDNTIATYTLTDENTLSFTFNALATPALVQSLLGNIAFENENHAWTSLLKKVSFSYDDGVAPAVSSTSNVTITTVNEAPDFTFVNPHVIDEDAAMQHVNITNINAGGAPGDYESQTLTLTVNSSTPGAFDGLPTLSDINYGAGTATLNFKPAADYYGNPTITLRLVDDNTAGLPINQITDKVFHITVNSVNDAPTNIALSNATHQENLLDLKIGNLSDTDIDGPGATYTITAGGDKFEVVNGNELKLKSNVSFESFPSLDVTVNVADGGVPAGSFEKTFTVTITNAPEAPTDIMASAASFDENLLANSTVATLSGADEDAGQAATLTYSLVAGVGADDNVAFTIAGDALKIAASPNFEAKNSYSIRVRATDADALTYDEVLTFAVNDLNEAPTAIDVTNTVNFDENNVARVQVADIATVDEDAGETFTYSFDAPNVALFEIENGHLYFKGTADYETKSSYDVTITSTDGAAHSISTNVTINVNDVNETPTLANIGNVTIDEDAAMQTVNLTGITAGPGETQPMTITATSNSLGLIPNPTVNYVSPEATGTLTFTPVANANGTATVTVRVTDLGGLFVEKTFNVTVNAVNDIPTITPIVNQTVAEDADATVINLTGISAGMPNEELEQTVVVTATSDNPALFSQFEVAYVDGSATGTLTFKPAANANGVAHVSVMVNDGMGSNNLLTSLFDITVTPVNDAPTMTTIAQFLDGYKNQPYEITYDELKDAANEADIDSPTINFQYSGGLNGNALQIMKSGSVIKTDAVAGVTLVETGDKLYWTPPTDAINVTNAFKVRAHDGAATSGEVMAVVDISHYNYAPTDLALSSMTLNENVADGFVVGTLTTTDPDLADTHTYSLVAGAGSTNNAKFSISGNQLRVNGANQIDFETLNALNIRLRTEDQDGLFFEKALTINVNNMNDVPTLAANATLAGGTEDTPIAIPYATLATTLNAQDQDAGATISFRIEGVNTGALTKGGLPVEAGVTTLASGESLLWTPALNANGATAAFTVKAYDGTAYSANAGLLNVNLAAVNDKPVLANLEGSLRTFFWDDHRLTGLNISDAITISDPEDASITSATIKLNGDSFLPGDALTFANTGAITGSWSDATKTLTLTGSDLLANYQAALRNVKFNTTNNRSTNYTVEFKVYDGALWSDATTRALKVVEGLAPQPTVQTSALAATNVRSAKMTLNWTAGNGAKRIILVREGAAVDFTPEDATAYAAQNSTTMDLSAAAIANGSNKVIFNGASASPLTITGLNPNSTYYFAAFEYNFVGGGVNYLTAAPATTNATTGKAATRLVIQPLAGGDIIASGSNFNLNVQLQDELGAPAYPTTEKTFDLTLQGAKFELSLGSPTSVSLTMDETEKTMTALNYLAKYGDANVTFKLDDGPAGYPEATRQFDVRAAKPVVGELGTQLTFQPVAGANLNVKWTVNNLADGVRYLLITKQGTSDGTPTFVPEDGRDYPANVDYSAADTYTDSYKAIYNGTRSDNSWQLVSNIPQNKYFRWKLYTYYGDTEDATTYNYNTANSQIVLNKTDLLKNGSATGVELSSLSAVSYERKVALAWETNREPNNLGFELYRSNENDYDNFELVGSYSSTASLATAGEKGGSYKFTDADPNLRTGAAYIYKLQAVMADGTKDELGLVNATVLDGANADAGLFVAEIAPNPVVDKVTTYFTLASDRVVRVELLDMTGKLVLIPIEGKIFKAGEKNAISFTMPLEAASGQYILSVTAGDEGVVAPFMFVK